MDPLLPEEPPRQAQEDALGGDTAQPPSLPHHIRQCLINHVLIISLLLISIGEHPELWPVAPKEFCLVDPARSQETTNSWSLGGHLPTQVRYSQATASSRPSRS